MQPEAKGAWSHQELEDAGGRLPRSCPNPVSDLRPPERERMHFCCLRPCLWPRQHTKGVGRAPGLGLLGGQLCHCLRLSAPHRLGLPETPRIVHLSWRRPAWLPVLIHSGCVLGHSVQLLETLWTEAHQAPLSMGFSRQEYWSSWLFPSPGDLPDPGIKPASLASPAGQAGSLPLHYLGWGASNGRRGLPETQDTHLSESLLTDLHSLTSVSSSEKGPQVGAGGVCRASIPAVSLEVQMMNLTFQAQVQPPEMSRSRSC